MGIGHESLLFKGALTNKRALEFINREQRREFLKVKGAFYPLAGPNKDSVDLWPSHSKSQFRCIFLSGILVCVKVKED